VELFWYLCPILQVRKKRAFNQQSNEEPVVWLGFLPAWQTVLGPALIIDPPSLSVCPPTHQPAGAPEAGGACETMWALIYFPRPDLRFSFFSRTSCLSLLPSISFHAYLTCRKESWRLGWKETRSAVRPVKAILKCCRSVFSGMRPQRLELVPGCDNFRSTIMSCSRQLIHNYTVSL